MRILEDDTIKIKLKPGFDLTDAEKAEAVFSQYGSVFLLKSGDDITFEGSKVVIALTPQDITLFEDGRYVPVEITVFFEDGKEATATVLYRYVNATRKERRQHEGGSGSGDCDCEDLSWLVDKINGEII